MLNRLFLLVCVFIYVIPKESEGQVNCNFSLSGKIICAEDRQTLPGANIQIGETQQGAEADSSGRYRLNNLCTGNVRLRITFIGYNSLDTAITISANRKMNFYLRPSDTHLHEVQVTAHAVERQKLETVTETTLQRIDIFKVEGQSLGDELKEIAGVDVLYTGATIAKPVIHGLYSNRILILNNGVRQEGQQWGDDHAPEIDPFIATNMTVIKGAASLRYGADAIGGVVLVQPADLPQGKSMDGEVNLVGMDNSRLFAGSGILQGGFDNGWSYRIQGTYRQAGQISTPSYILDNTGLLEKNYSATLGYDKKDWGFTIYYSHFYTELGIFTYSEASDPSDELALFKLPEPTNFPLSYYLNRPGGFYAINRPYQAVNHDLLKISAYLKSLSFGKLEATFAWQEDHRQEFGEDEAYAANGSLNNAPDNDFDMSSVTTELVFEHNEFHNISGSIGASFITQGNLYEGLAYTQLIPNFIDYGGGLFWIEKWNPSANFTLEGGVRFDYKWQQEYLINPNSPGLTYSNTQQYNSVTGMLGGTYRFSPRLSLDANIGNGWRSPSEYELYADGVHTTVSQWELGDSTLQVEKSYDFTTSIRYETKKIELEAGVYVNLINNYIYSRPLINPSTGIPEYHTDIEGTFPLFAFTQTDALFRGADIDMKWHITKHITYEPKITLILANDLTNHDYLVLIPPQRFQNTLIYKWDKIGKLKNVAVNLSNITVPEQTRVPPLGDIVPPPEGYSIFTAGIGCAVKFGKQDMNISLQANNLFNIRYRDYMDAFRYYANEPGRSIQLRVRIPFTIIPKAQQSSNP